MRRRITVLCLVIVAAVAFTFFVPVIYMPSYPVFCRIQGHFCIGSWLPSTGSITYWMFGYGGMLQQGKYQLIWS
ncbi:MAG: hypothetical protein ABR867_01940 [Nitrososphaerales archaeon]